MWIWVTAVHQASLIQSSSRPSSIISKDPVTVDYGFNLELKMVPTSILLRTATDWSRVAIGETSESYLDRSNVDSFADRAGGGGRKVTTQCVFGLLTRVIVKCRVLNTWPHTCGVYGTSRAQLPMVDGAYTISSHRSHMQTRCVMTSCPVKPKLLMLFTALLADHSLSLVWPQQRRLPSRYLLPYKRVVCFAHLDGNKF